MSCVIKDLVLVFVNLNSMEHDVITVQQDILDIHHVKVNYYIKKLPALR